MAPTTETKILAALFFLETRRGEQESCKKQVANMVNASMATFGPLLSRMVNKKGTVAYGTVKGTIKLTTLGKDKAATLTDPEEVVTSNEEVHEQIKKKLKGKMAREIFDFLLDGKEHSKEEVMKAVKCTNRKTFGPVLSRELKKDGYILYPSRETIKLSDKCFPFKTSEWASSENNCPRFGAVDFDRISWKITL